MQNFIIVLGMKIAHINRQTKELKLFSLNQLRIIKSDLKDLNKKCSINKQKKIFEKKNAF